MASNRIQIGYDFEGDLRLGTAEVIHETSKALLIQFDAISSLGSGRTPEVWLPKSQLEVGEEVGSFGRAVSVPAWWVAKNDLWKYVS